MSAPVTSRPEPETERRRGSAGPVLVFLMGVAAWFGAFGFWAQMESAAPIDVVRHQTIAIVLAVIGLGLFVVAALYDIAGRQR